MKKTRHVSFLLAALLTAFSTLSCASDDPGNDVSASSDTTADTTAVTTEAVTEPGPSSGVPEEVDLNGEEISIWYLNTAANGYNELNPEEIVDVIDDTTHNLNKTVEERLGCTLKFTPSLIKSSQCTNEIPIIIRADDGSYDMFCIVQWSGGKLVSEGLYYDISDAPYISFEEDWWDMDYMKEMSVGDSIYTLVGDYSTDIVRFLNAMLYNKNMCEDFYKDPNALYNIVNDGDWTFDQLKKISAEVYADLNDNGMLDRADRVGTTVGWNNDVLSLFYSTGARITERDADGIPTIVMNNEHTYDAFTKVHELSRHASGILYASDVQTNDSEKFLDGSAMFMFGQMKVTDLLRDMDDDYGIIPVPKMDDKQEAYLSTMQENLRFVALPVNCRNVESCCAVLEEMAFEGHDTLLPAYYDIVLKGQYFRDPVSGQMMDLIRRSITTDIAVIYGSGFADLCYVPRELIRTDSAQFISNYERLEMAAKLNSDKLIAQFNNLNK